MNRPSAARRSVLAEYAALFMRPADYDLVAEYLLVPREQANETDWITAHDRWRNLGHGGEPTETDWIAAHGRWRNLGHGGEQVPQ
jgi:hypothetical protein